MFTMAYLPPIAWSDVAGLVARTLIELVAVLAVVMLVTVPLAALTCFGIRE